MEKLNADGFQEKVTNSSGKVLVDFSAVWCGPCQALKPVLEAVAEKHAQDVKIYSLDIDENRQLAQQFNITAVPAMLLFVDGENTERLVGLQTGEAIENFLGLH